MTKQNTERQSSERTAIQLIYQYGPDFAELCPEIVKDARTMTHAQIVEYYEVAELFSVTNDIAISIVALAIRELLTPKECKALYSERLRTMHSRVGRDTMERGVGIWAMTPEQRSESSRRVGNIVGPRSRDEGFGLFGLDRKELERRMKEGNRFRKGSWHNESYAVDGMTPAQFALSLATLREYKVGPGLKYTGYPDYTKIHKAVEARYPGFSKTRSATKGFFENTRRRMRKMLAEE